MFRLAHLQLPFPIRLHSGPVSTGRIFLKIDGGEAVVVVGRGAEVRGGGGGSLAETNCANGTPADVNKHCNHHLPA